MGRHYYRRGYSRHYRGHYRRGSMNRTLRSAGQVARFGGRLASDAGLGALKFGAKAASCLVVTGVKTAAGIVRSLAGR